MFVTNGALLVNEVATRPHNSGHWSIEGAETSQFENHLRAVSGLSLGPTMPVAPYVTMVNIVGGENAPHWSELLSIEGIAVHEYRKANRPGRKLGHVTITSTDAMAHQQLVTRVRDILH
jgi:5-(carboxyamino)imidazole ribonucleotide synthase